MNFKDSASIPIIVFALSLGGCGGNDSPSNGPSDTSNDQVTTLVQLDPFFATVGDTEATIQVSGENFTPSSVVLWNGLQRQTRFISSERIETGLDSNDFANLGIAKVSIRNADGSESNHLPFFVRTSTPRFLYLATLSGIAETAFIYAFSINGATGELSSVPGSPFEFPNFRGRLVATPTGDQFYALDSAANSVLRLAVDGSTGALSRAGASSLVDSDWIQIDPAGEYLFTGHGVYDIDPSSGDLSSLPVSLDILPGVFDASARFSIQFDGNRIGGPDYTVNLYRFNRETIKFEFLSSLSLESGHTALGGIANPVGKGLVGVTQDSLDLGSLVPFNIDSRTGAVERVPGSINTWHPSTETNVFHESGRYAYSLDTDFSDVLLVNIDPGTGAISPGPVYDLPNDSSGTAIVGPVGEYLYLTAVSGVDRRQYVLSIPIDDQTGAPVVASATEYLLDEGPLQIIVVH